MKGVSNINSTYPSKDCFAFRNARSRKSLDNSYSPPISDRLVGFRDILTKVNSDEECRLCCLDVVAVDLKSVKEDDAGFEIMNQHSKVLLVQGLRENASLLCCPSRCC
jgi:hypothetical protein